MNALLLSLPGTPVIYYGDEIGMGDNIYLGDRNAVRTPMQWSADRNAGFSRANPQRLYLPTIIDPEYHYESLNVEAQQNNPNSLLWWMKRLIALRKRYRAFGRGSIEFLFPENRKVLVYRRRDRGARDHPPGLPPAPPVVRGEGPAGPFPPRRGRHPRPRRLVGARLAGRTGPAFPEGRVHPGRVPHPHPRRVQRGGPGHLR